ncbi:MAG TPA: SPFH domain-containing protein [Clostridia bacterium]|jgi:regulator of protease activity HflC (stomatin/prohibitin superfamily)|nr:SPFH domain-containing protein [Clostridia bacterium]
MILAISGGAIAGIIFAVLFALAIIAVAAGVRVVRQSTAIIVERLGKYHKTLDTGVHILIPFIDKASKPISLKEIVADFPPQSVITKDNVTMQIDTVVYFQVTDPKLFVYGVEKPLSAIENLTATTVRNIVGEMELDETLTSRDTINVKMREILDIATDAWGIKVNRVELKNILPPKSIQEAMEKQMRAERERREQILRAEGEKTSSILVAEGERQAQILRAEAEKQTRILKAEAERDAQIAEAEGKSKEVELINKAKPSKEYLTIASFDAMVKVANGQSVKIIIPSELQNMAGFAAALVESTKEK